MTGVIRIIDTKGLVIYEERFQSKYILKKKLRALHLKHWNKLENLEWEISILMDATEK